LTKILRNYHRCSRTTPNRNLQVKLEH